MDSCSDSDSSWSGSSASGPRSHATHSNQDTPTTAASSPTLLSGGPQSSDLPQDRSVGEVLPTEDTALPFTEASRVGLGYAELPQHIDTAQNTAISAKAAAPSHPRSEVFQPRPDPNATSNSMSDAHPRQPRRLTRYTPHSTTTPAQQPVSLSVIIDRGLQECMLSHDSADFACTMQVCGLVASAVQIVAFSRHHLAHIVSLGLPIKYMWPTDITPTWLICCLACTM